MKLARLAVITLAMALFAGRVASAEQSTVADPAVMATVNAVLSAAQSGDMKLWREQYLPGATLVDEFAPFMWTGANSLDSYFASALQMFEETKQTDINVTAGAPKFTYESGPSAYVVVPLTVVGKLAGAPFTANGSLAFTLQKTSAGWKISTQTWVKDSETRNPY